MGGTDGVAAGRRWLTLAGGQGAGSPVLSQAPPPPIPSGQIKKPCAVPVRTETKQKWIAAGGWAGSLGGGSNQDRAAPTPSEESRQPASQPPALPHAQPLLPRYLPSKVLFRAMPC